LRVSAITVTTTVPDTTVRTTDSAAISEYEPSV